MVAEEVVNCDGASATDMIATCSQKDKFLCDVKFSLKYRVSNIQNVDQQTPSKDEDKML